MAYTDITTRAGKGSRPESNVSTKVYRAGYDRIFGKKRSKSAPAKPAEPKTFQCTECEGYGELPQGSLTVPCHVCQGTGKLVYENKNQENCS